ncbi:MAG: cupin domain-containing protein [Akkermansiaceae bacterium]
MRPAGWRPPAHIYTREEEAIYLLEGKLTFYGAYNEIRVGPGDYLNIPK